MKRLYTQNLSVGTANYPIERGQYKYFEIRYSGVAGAGNTITLANLGNVRLNWSGDDKVNVPVSALSNMANLYNGFIEFNSAIGGAFAASIIIPCGEWFDTNNIYDVADNDKANFILDFPALPALIASGVVQIYGVLQNGLHSYFHKILSQNVVAGGAGVLVNNIFAQNIAQLYLTNPAALISDIQVSIDGKNFINGDTASELAFSNWIHQIEATGTFFAFEFCPSKKLETIVSNSLSFQYTFTGAGTQEQLYSAIEFTPKKQQTSALGVANSVLGRK